MEKLKNIVKEEGVAKIILEYKKNMEKILIEDEMNKYNMSIFDPYSYKIGGSHKENNNIKTIDDFLRFYNLTNKNILQAVLSYERCNFYNMKKYVAFLFITKKNKVFKLSLIPIEN